MRASPLVLCLALGCASSSAAPKTPEVGSYSEPAASNAVLEAEALLSAGKYAQAVEVLERALAENRDDSRAWLDLGLAREGLGKPKQAADAYGKAAELAPDFAEAFNNLGVVLREWGSLDDAITALERAVRLKPDLVDAQLNLAMAYEDSGALEKAERAYAHVIKLSPADPVPQVNQGLLYIEMGRLSAARKRLTSARKLAKGDADLLTSIGGVLRRAKAPNGALATLNEAMDAEPDEPSAALLGELALTYYAKGRFVEAEQTMKSALDKRPKDPGLRYAYATMLVRNEKLPEARKQLNDIVRADPKSTWAERARTRLEAIEGTP